MSSDKPNRLLQQVPLIVSPFYHPPQPLKLNFDVNSIPTSLEFPLLTGTGAPTVEEELERWCEEINRRKHKIAALNELERSEFLLWKDAKMKRFAPGYLDNVLIPSAKAQSKVEEPGKVLGSLSSEPEVFNELDRVFGNVKIAE
ncbi:hypothetical protein BABINDRAFT_7253 [Babjeviella inositovora NRRL Y-12698]|uniref:Multivesicular body sorting factor 12 domain-containing protein n=1 Tax=Babjeviella inositovora NRRL Y-12698 TaxID=984486 RepID=A0A1E3QUB5_9ASCO|nr:uncharacterized protein BABINDRAFT_7253 [Babjeviella inositovora NRRL Y-12698]ODQ80527.1 hypothetical protein BABINDRAFT_7253 [Babjeviella inositovora NRRL Y-12698]